MDIKLIHHLIDNTLTPEECDELLACVRAHRTKTEFFSLFDKVWSEAGDHALIPQDVKDDIYRNLMVAIGNDEDEESKEIAISEESTKRHFLRLSPRIKNLAVACIIGVLALGCVMMYFKDASSSRAMAERSFMVIAESGQKADVDLPDGTHVWLNSDSRLIYPADYGTKERRVKLDGEASFKVTKDASCRFIVDAKDVITEALGTEFNVRAYKNNDYVSVSLYEGSVKVEYDSNETILEPMEEVRVQLPGGEMQMTRNELENEPAWKRNELVFNGETLQEIAEIMTRTFATEVVIIDNELAKEQFVGTINNTNITNFINIISLVAPIDYYFENDTLYITRITPPHN